MKHIWYVHGAYSTSRAFQWLKDQLPEHRATNIDYSSQASVRAVIDQMTKVGDQEAEPFDVIGHSLGGLMAVALSKRCANVRRIATLSSPFGGSRWAAFVQFLAPGTLLGDIQPFSGLVQEVRTGDLRSPTLSVVTTGGNTPFLFEHNDGVVTLASQRALHGPRYVEISVNHFEVLLDADVAGLVKSHLWTTPPTS
jgi:pimeloyl-ACP methyl ester carboxylesterase